MFLARLDLGDPNHDQRIAAARDFPTLPWRGKNPGDFQCLDR